MDVSYLLYALRYHRDNRPDDTPAGYQEAMDWIIEHVDQNWFHFDDILDGEGERRELNYVNANEEE